MSHRSLPRTQTEETSNRGVEMDDLVMKIAGASLGVITLLWIIVSYFKFRSADKANKSIDRRLDEIINSEKDTDIIGNLSAELLRDSISQSRSANMFSLISSTASLGILAYVIYVSINQSGGSENSWISLVASVLANFVSTIFIYQASKAREASERQFKDIESNSRNKGIRDHLKLYMDKLSLSTDGEHQKTFRELVKEYANVLNR